MIPRSSHSRFPGRLTRDYKAVGEHVGRAVGRAVGRLTWDYQVVSLAITRPTKLRFPEIAISGKIVIFDFPDFFVNKSGKIRKIVFLDS